MADTIIKAGDFTGFSFAGVHSSRLGIIRVSNGDRYNEILRPEFEDKTNTIPGGDGLYYFGSNFQSKTFSISIAFDHMTEKQFRLLQRIFSTKESCDLIFDERPYKVYSAKLSQPIELNYICFNEHKKSIQTPRDGVRVIERDDEWNITREQVEPYTTLEEKERIYKGEGTIDFVCTYPFARQQFKILDQYGPFEPLYDNFGRITSYNANRSESNPITIYTNINEWAEASGILSYNNFQEKQIDQVISSSVTGYNRYIPVYNPGDLPSPFYLYLPYNSSGKLQGTEANPNITLNIYNDLMLIEPFNSKKSSSEENGVIINTYNHLIEGVLFDVNNNSWNTTGSVYNEHILAGDFHKINNINWGLDPNDLIQAIYINCSTAGSARIFYNYIYY